MAVALALAVSVWPLSRAAAAESSAAAAGYGARAADGWQGSIAESLRMRLESLRAGESLRVSGEPLAAPGLIGEYYAQRGFAPAWVQRARRESLLVALRDSPSHGLDPDDYRLVRIERLHAAALAAEGTAATVIPRPGAPARPGSWNAAQAADLELLLTDAVVRFGYHLRFGKAEPRELDRSFNFDRSLRGLDPLSTLSQLVAASDHRAALERLAPRIDAYSNLRRALGRLQAIERAGGWPSFGDGPTLELGSRGARVRALRARLALEAQLWPEAAVAPAPATGTASGVAGQGGVHPPPASDPSLFDEALQAAVRRFQLRHGLDDDGIVGPRTSAALRASVQQRIDQVRVNLDRIRWVAHALADDFLMVDIAGFRAELWLDGARVWESRAVVGRPYRTTPVFRATLQYLVFNPDWTVPPTILRKDVLPKVIANPAYLREHSMRVLTADGRRVDPAAIDWARYRSGGFPYQIVQVPGARNPLGRIKFMFPNRYSVYLHDTPSRQLFERAERAFSSGCIRVERPIELARLLLDDADRWSLQAIDSALQTGKTRSEPVRRRVPVLILYFTATADADGVPWFRHDLYARDARVLAALGQPFRFGDIDTGPGRR